MSGLSGSRFTAQNQTTSDRLSTNTVGLVALSDFRKRRAEVLEQQEREAREAARGGGATAAEGAAGAAGAASGSAGGNGGGSGGDGSAATSVASAAGSDGDGDGPKTKKTKTKTKRNGKGDGRRGRGGVTKLSFFDEEGGGDDDDEGTDRDGENPDSTTTTTIAKTTTTTASGLPVPKSFTKQALRRQAAEREALRREFLVLQAAVKATEVAIPFVFYEGADIPGGVVRVKKGDFVWLFLDRSRKVGARLGVGEKKPSKARLHWARIGVDDLMLVRGNLILPHHYDFYYFIMNKTIGPGGIRVFDYSAEAPKAAALDATTAPDTADTTDAPATPATPDSTLATPGSGDAEEDHSMLEGAGDNPSLTKVVDRRWYERNKHIYPANVWQDFDPEQDYTQQVRRDQGGNAYFFAGK